MNFNVRQKKVLEATEPKILCLATAACGKSLPNSTVIPTPSGPRRVDEINVGDYLFDRNGLPTKVLGVYPQGKREVYELTFGDGRKAKSSIDHIWYVHKKTWRNKDKYREYTTQQLLDEGLIRNDRSANFSIPCSSAVKYKEKKYDVSPYVIGTMLGDGCCTGPYLTISSEDDTIPRHIASLINSDEIYKNPSSFSWTFKKEGHLIKNEDFLPEELLHYSYDKKIPEEYKYGSIEQRLELIRGLMDADGTITHDKRSSHNSVATISYCSTSYSLILDVKEVLGSLGYISSINVDNRNDKYTNKECYRLIINIPNQDKHKLFWLPRKREIALSVKDLPQKRDYSRTSIREIKSLGYEEEMTCFLVDNEEHLFLMNDFIVTHNTRVLTERIRILIEEKGVNPSDIVAITFTNMAADEMRRRLGSTAGTAFIGTLHSYANKICLLNSISTDKYIANNQFDMILKKAMTIPSDRYVHVKHVLVDECQDLCPIEYAFIEKIPTENVFFVGDNRQAIYGFKGSTDEYLVSMYKDDNYKKYYLVENYRNAPRILKFADSLIASFIQLSPKSIPVKTKQGDVIEETFTEALEELEYSGNWGSWFILTRTNNELATVQEILDRKNIPNVTFKKGDLEDNSELDNIMASDRVKVLTIHSSKGLENKSVIVVGARTYNEEERKIAYVGATRAENTLYWCPTIAKRNVRKTPKKNYGVIEF